MPPLFYTTEHAVLQMPVIESVSDPTPEPHRPTPPASRREPKPLNVP